MKAEKREWRCNKKIKKERKREKKKGNNHYHNWSTNKIYYFSITFEL